MSIDIAIVLGTIAVAFILFVTETFPIEVTALAMLAFFLLIGFLTPSEAITGFSNPAVITIALLFILSMAVEKTHILEFLVVKINRMFNKNITVGLFLFLVTIAIASALVNNTAIVAIFIPITIRIAQTYRISPSKLLIPLSYAAILGGTLTLVGTSTNLIVNSLLVEYPGQRALGMFEFTKYGIFPLMVGIAYILFIARKLLPSRTVTSSLTKSFHMGGFLTELKIEADSPLIGKTCLERNINQNYDVTVLDILRDKRHITTNIRNTVLQEGDVLFVRGSLDNFLRMKEVERVAMLTDRKLNEKELQQDENILVECLLTEKSDMIGKTLKSVNFRRKFGSFVLAIRKEGEILRLKIAHAVLSAYDTLLVYGPRDKIETMAGKDDFIVLEEYSSVLHKRRFWWVSLALIILVVILAATGLVPILKGALIAVAILWLFNVMTPNDSYRAIRWQVIILISTLIPIGIVIQHSGTADWIGHELAQIVRMVPERFAPYAVLAAVYLVTILLTEISSNAATAIIMTPVVMAMAAELGLEVRPFIFAICFAASASFITPVGYQTNLMVYGPGGYKFTDYMKVGFPLSFLLWIMATLVIPLLWPFTSV
ncbi:MAG: SLC13 family permease [Fidelibacterota bacterium]